MKIIKILALWLLVSCAHIQAQNFPELKKHLINGFWKTENPTFLYSIEYYDANEFNLFKITKGDVKHLGYIKIQQNGSFKLSIEGKDVEVIITPPSTGIIGKDEIEKVGGLDYVPKFSTQETAYRSATITKITIESINTSKPSGASWDNAIGNYKPDVFLEFRSPYNELLWTSPQLDDVDNLKCPISISFAGVSGAKIMRAHFGEDYGFVILDRDNTSSPDTMFTGSIRISRHKEGDNFAIYEKNGFKIKLELVWE